MKASKLIKSAALLFRGFTFATADEWLYLDGIKKYKRKNNIGMSDKEIFSLLPFDAKFDKLFGDVLSMSYALDKHTELLPEQYYSLLTRDGERFILPLRDGLEQSMDGVLALIREKGRVSVRKASNSVKTKEHVCGYDGEAFYFDSACLDEDAMREKLGSLPSGTIISELIVSDFAPTVHLAFLNSGDAPELLFSVLTAAQENVRQNWYTQNREISAVDELGNYDGGRIEAFPEIAEALRAIASEFNELEYMNFAVRLTGSSFKITLIRKKDDEKTLMYVHELSDIFRYILQSDKKGLVTLREELEFIQSFRYVMEVRFANKLVFSIRVDEAVQDELTLPVLSLLPLVENVTVHNMIDSEHKMEISIRLNEQNELVVSNPVYPKLSPPDTNGTGLKNLESRFALLMNKQIRVECDEETFRVYLPLK